MVARITFPKSMEAALNYNEQKVQQQKAHCLSAVNFLRDARDMNFYQKAKVFARLNALNERASTRTIHVSLNFSPTERLEDGRMLDIAGSYMERIGFGGQPYLVYKHEDAGHPHIHIVSTTIQHDGSRINTHNIGRNQSEVARKGIETQFGLVKAEEQKKLMSPSLKPVDASVAEYGRHETRQAISNAVSNVFNRYLFASLPEFNAALRQFNIVADRGIEGGRIHTNRGLVYRILDSEGNKVGVPIKASIIACQPTLDNLEKKFTSNAARKHQARAGVTAKLDTALSAKPATLGALVHALKKQAVQTVLRQNAEGRIYGITFVDNYAKCVFNGSDLGRQYSVAGLGATIGNLDLGKPGKVEWQKNMDGKQLQQATAKEDSLIDMLMSPREQMDNVPFQLLKKKRKKKKKGSDF